MFLMWEDHSKKPTAQKIAEARAAYVARFKATPNIVLTHPTEQVDAPGVQSRAYVRPGNYWIGWEEGVS